MTNCCGTRSKAASSCTVCRPTEARSSPIRCWMGLDLRSLTKLRTGYTFRRRCSSSSSWGDFRFSRAPLSIGAALLEIGLQRADRHLLFPESGVDHHRNFAIDDLVDNVRPPLVDLLRELCLDTFVLQVLVGSGSADDLEAQSQQAFGEVYRPGLIVVLDRDEHFAGSRQAHASGELAFRKRHRKGIRHSHYFAG